jgi:hypothetical protein
MTGMADSDAIFLCWRWDLFGGSRLQVAETDFTLNMSLTALCARSYIKLAGLRCSQSRGCDAAKPLDIIINQKL